MPFLTDNEIDDFRNDYSQHFSFFSQFHSLVVWKEPKKIITEDNNYFPGYGNASMPTVTYEPVSGSFPVMVCADDKGLLDQLSNTRNLLPKGQVRIKISGDARDYIRNGKTEYVTIDGDQSFKVISEDTHQHYLGQEYFYFILERTN